MSRKARPLLTLAFAPSTQKRYSEAVLNFVAWLVQNQEDAPLDAIDDTLLDYFHYLFDAGAGKSQAQMTLFGLVMYLPRLRHRFPLCAVALRGWNKVAPSVSYPPLTLELTCALSATAALSGEWRAGVAIYLAFHGLLRISEFLSLKTQDVAVSGDLRLGLVAKHVSLRLRTTKTGPNQFVTLHDPAVLKLLDFVLDRTPPGGTLFPYSPHVFRRLFKSFCSTLGLSAGYVPHSLRHGGATFLHLKGTPIEDILLRGRWSSNKSARRYIQAGRALLLSVEVPVRVAELGARMLPDFFSIFISSLRSTTT